MVQPDMTAEIHAGWWSSAWIDLQVLFTLRPLRLRG